MSHSIKVKVMRSHKYSLIMRKLFRITWAHRAPLTQTHQTRTPDSNATTPVTNANTMTRCRSQNHQTQTLRGQSRIRCPSPPPGFSESGIQLASATGKPLGFRWIHVQGFIKLARKNLDSGLFSSLRGLPT